MSTGTGTGTRAARQARIVEIVSREQVRSQTELLLLLEAEGIETTQATLSRDLDELGAVKLRRARRRTTSPARWTERPSTTWWAPSPATTPCSWSLASR